MHVRVCPLELGGQIVLWRGGEERERGSQLTGQISHSVKQK